MSESNFRCDNCNTLISWGDGRAVGDVDGSWIGSDGHRYILGFTWVTCIWCYPSIQKLIESEEINYVTKR